MPFALLLLAAPGVAWAHANFVRAEPAADAALQATPERLQLWFGEPLEPRFSEVQVFDANRQRVDRGDSRVPPGEPASLVVSLQPLEQGTYTVAWQALSSVDGHLTRGLYGLSIGVAPTDGTTLAAPDASAALPFEAATRWLAYLSAAALVGALLFRLLTLGPVAEAQGVGEVVLPAALPALHRLAWASWAGLLVATLEALGLQLAAVGGGESGPALRAMLGQLLFGTRYGLVWLARLGLVLGLGLALLWLARAGTRGRGDAETRGDEEALSASPRLRVPASRESPPPGKAAWWLGAGLGGGALLTYSLNSHSAAAGDLAALAVAADWLHLVAVAVWVGGLFSLVLVLPAGLKVLPPAERGRLLAGLVPRFSVLAVASVGVLVATGLYQAWLHVGSPSALLETLYGQGLLAKLGLATPLLLLGAANLLILRPRLAAAAQVGGGRVGGWWLEVGSSHQPPTSNPSASNLGRYFSRLVRAEVALAALVLLAAGVLTGLPPARQAYEQLAAARPLALHAQARTLRLSLAIAPARPGPSTFTVLLQDAQGRPVDGAERVSLTFDYLDQPLGTGIELAEPQGEGRYAARGAFIGLEGLWRVGVLARLPGQDDERAAFLLRVGPTSAQEEQPNAGAAPGVRWPTLNLMSLMALGLAVLGAGLMVYVARTVGLRSLEGGMLVLAGAVVVGLGIFLAVRTQQADEAAQRVRALRNPFPPTQESLAVGEEVYRTQCQLCHGVAGRGDGPAGAMLNPRPSDFRVHLAAGHTDGELFTWVGDGMRGTAMPAFRDQLTEAERWHVINFIKALASSGG
ncbi:MAG: copper resistance protein CopC [Chloroflexi bacterium]|nr:copper resistance protein CopC [Chloroflexota bacterium]